MEFEKIMEILRHISEARRLTREEWDRDRDDHRAAGCYKALDAIINAIQEEDDKKKYTFARLIEAMSRLADYYGITFEEALQIGEVQYFMKH